MTQINENWLEKFVEKGANIEHIRWAKWQEYVFSICKLNKDGTAIIPKWAIDQWTRQINTNYADLSDSEKESDKKEVRSYIPIIEELSND